MKTLIIIIIVLLIATNVKAINIYSHYMNDLLTPKEREHPFKKPIKKESMKTFGRKPDEIIIE